MFTKTKFSKNCLNFIDIFKVYYFQIDMIVSSDKWFQLNKWKGEEKKARILCALLI